MPITVAISPSLNLNLTATDLPALVGSAKQVEWAGKIRDEAIIQVSAAMHRAINPLTGSTNLTQAAALAQAEPAVAKLVAKIDALTAASWWIDNRGGLDNIGAVRTIMTAAR